MRRKFLSVVASIIMMVATLVVGGLMTAAPAGAAGSDYGSPCYNTGSWNTAAEVNNLSPRNRVDKFRAARHTRCDRIVFEFANSRQVGYNAHYGQAEQGGSGFDIPVAGRVKFSLTINAPASGAVSRNGAILYSYYSSNTSGWTVRQVKSGGHFEGYTDISIGLRKVVRWRLFTALLTNGHRVLVLEFARY